MRIGWRDSILRAMADEKEADPRLAPTFVGIIVVQILVVLGLYWVGRVFGS